MTDPFWDDGYLIVEDMISPAQVAFVASAMDTQSRIGKMVPTQTRYVTGAEDQYSPVPAAILLKHCLPRIEQLVGKDLLVGYAYWRKYSHAAVLRSHVDRATCEISVTVAIGTEPSGSIWPFHIEDLHGNRIAIALSPGAGVIYQGHRVKHWREPLQAEWHKQMFLHYVLKDGEFADHVFDKNAGERVRRIPV
ncbi:hypothetical protein [Erythrobacter sp. JK5]|uniref:hypothetical protein n=1 Tax=Erythrobacter sp. JK5 TaxID=2829500 RepID=UPI001BAAC54F|nr:hypothetical protein [Erythrobacter sp. JK5]QUL38314.1 hypothetical protein KDC96_02540 [Erythrobacter sp. JK5]